jgi:chromosome partitioning protein
MNKNNSAQASEINNPSQKRLDKEFNTTFSKELNLYHEYPVSPKTATIVSVMNQKGGVGKTTTAINLGASLAHLGCRVLVVDYDGQCNATLGLGHSPLKSIEEFLKQKPVKTDMSFMDFLCATPYIVHLETEAPHFSLRDQLSLYEQFYDFILIDMPPSMGFLTVDSLMSSHKVLVPSQCEFFSLQGINQILTTVQVLNRHHPGLAIQGYLLTMYDQRNTLHRNIRHDMKESFGALIYESLIPRNVSVADAAAIGKPVLLYDRTCTSAQAYLKVALEFLKRENIFLK